MSRAPPFMKRSLSAWRGLVVTVTEFTAVAVRVLLSGFLVAGLTKLANPQEAIQTLATWGTTPHSTLWGSCPCSKSASPWDWGSRSLPGTRRADRSRYSRCSSPASASTWRAAASRPAIVLDNCIPGRSAGDLVRNAVMAAGATGLIIAGPPVQPPICGPFWLAWTAADAGSRPWSRRSSVLRYCIR